MEEVTQERTHGESTSRMGFLLGLLLLVVLVIALIYWGLPYLGSSGTNLNVPAK